MNCSSTVASLCALTAVSDAQGPADWFRLQVPESRSEHALGVDQISGDVIVHGGSLRTFNGATQSSPYTWRWSAAGWVKGGLQTDAFPPSTTGQQFLVDATHARLLLLGGMNESPTGNATREDSIWQYAAGVWTSLPVGPTRGPITCLCTAAYDDLRDRIVVFGGSAPILNPVVQSWLPDSDTWEWSSGAGWTRLTPASSPPARLGGSLAFDRTRARTVLFGGWGGSTAGLLSDTWEWNGVTWQQALTPTTPPPRSCARLVHDPNQNRCLLVGGYDASGTSTDIWSFAGGTWTSVGSTQPLQRDAAGIAWHPQRQTLMLMGGQVAVGATEVAPLSDLWEWNGAGWQMLAPAAAAPMQAAVSDLAHATVVGVDDACRIWQRSGRGWAMVPTTVSPPWRQLTALAHDVARARTVLFGGIVTAPLGDVWEWDGVAWTQPQPASGPSPRFGAAMAFDPAGGGVLLFGGDTGTNRSNETWRWDGTVWTQLSSASTPSPRTEAAMAADPVRNVVVLCGGFDNGALHDTWEWNGTQWLDCNASWGSGSSPRATYDYVRGVIALAWTDRGPNYNTNIFSEWNGSTWTASGSWARRPWSSNWLTVAFAFDLGSTCCVLDDATEGASWEITTVQQVPTTSSLGTGCIQGSSMSMPFAYPGEWSSISLGVPNPHPPLFLALGWSHTTWQGQPLPMDLTPFGAAGCSLLVRPDAVLFLSTQYPGIEFFIPANPTLGGAELSAQGFMFAPLANSAGILLSEGASMRLGMR